MALDLISKAQERKAEAERRLKELQDVVATLIGEVSQLNSFLSTAEMLTNQQNGSPPQPKRPKPSVGRVQVKRSAWVGLAAKLILEKGPRGLKEIVADLMQQGHGKDVTERTVYVNVNSALWRRKDVFAKDGKNFKLRTEDLEFVD